MHVIGGFRAAFIRQQESNSNELQYDNARRKNKAQNVRILQRSLVTPPAGINKLVA